MSFKIEKVFFDDRILPLTNNDYPSNNDNFVTVIVGKNSIGKSRLLSAIISSFESLDSDKRIEKVHYSFNKSSIPLSDFSLSYQFNEEKNKIYVKKGLCFFEGESSTTFLPKKIIASSTSAYDKFPFQRGVYNRNYEETGRYRYFGTKEHRGLQSTTTLLDRVINSLFKASIDSKDKLLKLNHVFSFLGYSPRLTVSYHFDTSPKRFLAYFNKENEHNHLDRHPRIRHALDKIENDNILASEVIEAYEQLDDFSMGKREIIFDVDFNNGNFKVGSLDMFTHTHLLRSLGLMRLSDISLYSDQSGKEIVSIREASSGEQSIIATILGIASEIENDSLICIDEPEISLHPEWQEKFIDLLMETFSNYEGCHFIIATHSPQILARIQGKNCSILKMDTGQLLSANKYYKKSSDFQLATLLDAPGYSNEYLAREALSIITTIGTGNIEKLHSSNKLKLLLDIRPLLDNIDPVAGLIDAIDLAMKDQKQ